MTILDRPVDWVDSMRMVPDLIGIEDQVDLDKFKYIDICQGAMGDITHLDKYNEEFVRIGMKTVYQLRGFERGQPEMFAPLDDGFPARALLYRSDSISPGQDLVLEAVLLPVQWGLLTVSVDVRKRFEYTGTLQKKHLFRTICWRDHYPFVAPARGRAFAQLTE